MNLEYNIAIKLFIMKIKRKNQAFITLMKMAPLNSQSDILNNLEFYYDPAENSADNMDLLIDYNTSHLTILKYGEQKILLTNDNIGTVSENFKAAFYDYSYDPITKKEHPKKAEVNLLELKVESYEDCEASDMPSIFFKSVYLTTSDFRSYLNRRYPGKDLLKHFLFVNEDDIFKIHYTIKNYKNFPKMYVKQKL